MPTIYLILSQTGTLPSRAFKQITRQPFNHLSISLNQDLTLLYSFARRTPHNPFNAGFIQECLRTGTFASFPQTQCQIYKLDITQAQYCQLTSLIQHFETYAHQYNYNFAGLLFLWAKIPISRDNHYVCSQFVGYLLEQIHIPLPKPYTLLLPTDIRELPQLRLWYEGYLYDYPFLTPSPQPYLVKNRNIRLK